LTQATLLLIRPEKAASAARVLTAVLVSGMLNGAKFRIDEVVFGLARKQL
jgi:hypothetical protein